MKLPPRSLLPEQLHFSNAKILSGNCPPWNSPMTIAIGILPPARLPLNNSLLTNTLRNIIPIKFPSEQLLKSQTSKASIATVDSRTGDIINPFLELWVFSTFFHWCCVIESLSLNKLFLALKLLLAVLTANYLDKDFKHVCLKEVINRPT